MQSKEAPKNPSGGKVGVLLPMFASGWNSAPDKSFLANKNYPAIRGILDIKGLNIYILTTRIMLNN